MEVAHGEMAMVAALAETRNDLRMTLRLADLDLFNHIQHVLHTFCTELFGILIRLHVANELDVFLLAFDQCRPLHPK